MSEHFSSITDEILYMQSRMGDDADLNNAENLDQYEDELYELSTEELYDTYSFVYDHYRRWLKEQKQNANSA